MRPSLKLKVLLLLFCISCNNGRLSELEIAPELSGLLKSISVKNSELEYELKYDYHNRNTLKSITHVYEDSKMTEYFQYENDTLRFSTKADTLKKYIYEYGKLKYLIKSLKNNPEVYELLTYSYYDTGKLFLLEKRLFNEQGNDFLSETTFTWSGENVTHVRENLKYWVTINSTIAYNATLNPIHSLYFNTLRIPPEDLNGLSLNNFKEIKKLDNTLLITNTSNKNKFVLNEIWKVFEDNDSIENKIQELNFEYYD